MSRQKHQQNPEPERSGSAEENRLVAQLVQQSPQIAQTLSTSTTPAEVEEALTSINEQSEAVQIAYLKTLAKEKTTAAADVLAAVNAFATAKEVRKEAKRSLIRLETSKIYPLWTAPATVVEADATNPPRFWKGIVTDSKEYGEVQLMLFWEQGTDYKDMLMMGFLLEFWKGGVKDFFQEISSRSHAEKHIKQMHETLTEIRLKPCSLSEARELIQEALAINEQEHTRPHSDYNRSAALVRKLILTAPDEEEDEQLTPGSSTLPDIPTMPQSILDTFFPSMLNEEVVKEFIDAWIGKDYEMAYDLLSTDSPLRDGLSREEWVSLRQQWSQEAQPTNLAVQFIQDRDAFEEELEDIELDEDAEEDETDEDLETEEEDEDELDGENEHPIIDLSWSLEFIDTPSSRALKELPQATVVYPETGQHWFWTSYTLVQEDDDWRIQNMTDEGANLTRLSIEEIQQRQEEISQLALVQIQHYKDALNLQEAEDENREEEEDEDEEKLDEEFLSTLDNLQESLALAARYLHYSDALISKSPGLDSNVYRQSIDFSMTFGDFGRAAWYLQRMADHYPDQRADTLRELTLVYLNLSNQYNESTDEGKAQQFLALSENTIREALRLDHVPENMVTLAQILTIEGEALDEAESLLHEAEQRSPNDRVGSLIQVNLAKIAEIRDNPTLALEHYQRGAAIRPDFPGIWVDIGFLQRELEQYEEAVTSLQQSLKLDPGNIEAYIGLGDIYRTQFNDLAKAEEVLLEGLEVEEESPELLGSLSMIYIEKGNLREAEMYLEMAEELDSDSAFIHEVRDAFQTAKAHQRLHAKNKGDQRKARKAKKKR
jgi:tetratricopeptide (TPR) repeat protein